MFSGLSTTPKEANTFITKIIMPEKDCCAVPLGSDKLLCLQFVTVDFEKKVT